MGGKKLEGSSSNPSSSITSDRLQVEEYDPFGGRSYVIEKLLAPHPPKVKDFIYSPLCFYFAENSYNLWFSCIFS